MNEEGYDPADENLLTRQTATPLWHIGNPQLELALVEVSSGALDGKFGIAVRVDPAVNALAGEQGVMVVVPLAQLDDLRKQLGALLRKTRYTR